MADLKAHARFFDLLVEAVPAKYYLDAGEEKVRRGVLAAAVFRPPAPVLPAPLLAAHTAAV